MVALCATPMKMNGVICRKCGGSGCATCNQTGYFKAYYLKKGFEGTKVVMLPMLESPSEGGKPMAKRKKAARKAKPSGGGGVTHKAYTYTNKKGKTVHVASHVEHLHRKK